MKNQTYEEFYLKYRKISRAYAYGVLHDWNISDDVSQDVLYKMYTKRKHLNIDNEKNPLFSTECIDSLFPREVFVLIS